jgi:hypothetical protein
MPPASDHPIPTPMTSINCQGHVSPREIAAIALDEESLATRTQPLANSPPPLSSLLHARCSAICARKLHSYIVVVLSGIQYAQILFYF